jgi:hypothetical protein
VNPGVKRTYSHLINEISVTPEKQMETLRFTPSVAWDLDILRKLKEEMKSQHCHGPGCMNPAIPGRKCCSDRCTASWKALLIRRRRGVLPRAEAIAALGDRTCALPSCGKKFTPLDFKQKYCKVACRAEAGRIAKNLAAKIAPPNERERCLNQLDEVTVLPNLKPQKRTQKQSKIDWNEYPWIPKEEFFQTDKRSPETMAIVAEAKRYLEQEGEMSLRFLFYHLASIQLIANTRQQYAYLTEKMTTARERGGIASNAFSDSVRESLYDVDVSMEDFKADISSYYHSDLWKNQKQLIEIWTEKDSIVSVVEDTVREYKVPLRILRGQGSTPYLVGIAHELRGTAKPIYVFYLGDHDPAGLLIEKSARRRLYAFLMEENGWTSARVAASIRWKKIGFLHEDFDEHDIEALPEDDKQFGKEAFLELYPDGKRAELEGLEPTEIRRRVREVIEKTMGTAGLKQRTVDLKTEVKERRKLDKLLGVA